MIAVITGGSRGLGWHLTDGLGAAGYEVIYISRKPAAEKFGAPGVVHLPGDLEQAEIVAGDLRDLIGGRKVDVFIHNAGISEDVVLLKQTAEAWERVMSVNFMSLVHLWAAVRPSLNASPAATVGLIGSRIGVTGAYSQTLYAASKGLLIDFMQSQVEELGRDGIRINVIHPGFMDTDMSRAYPKALERARRNSLISQIGEPGLVAQWVLGQILTTGITGQVLQFDSRR